MPIQINMKILTKLQSNTGIYKITCLSNLKFYIGSSLDIYRRFKDHNKLLKANKHDNHYLQNSYNKYGTKNFIFEVIEYCEKEKLIEREQFYLDNLKPYERDIGFNICRKAYSAIGTIKSETCKEKISQKCIERTGIEYELVSPEGKVYRGKGLRKFTKEMNIKYRDLHCLTTGESKISKGWQIKGQELEVYKFLNPIGNLITIAPRKLKDFCKKNNLNYKMMCNVWQKQSLTHHGWSRFENKDFYVTLIHKNGEHFIMNKHYQKNFIKKYNSSCQCISNLLHGVNKSSKGWVIEK